MGARAVKGEQRPPEASEEIAAAISESARKTQASLSNHQPGQPQRVRLGADSGAPPDIMHKSREPLTSSKALQPVTTIFGLKLFIFTFFSILVFRSAREASDRIMIGLQSGYATCAKDTAPSGLAAWGKGSAQQPARQSAEGDSCVQAGEVTPRAWKRPGQRPSRVPALSPHTGAQMGLLVHTQKSEGPRLPCSLISRSSRQHGSESPAASPPPSPDRGRVCCQSALALISFGCAIHSLAFITHHLCIRHCSRRGNNMNTADKTPCIQGACSSGVMGRDTPRRVLSLISLQNQNLWFGGCS